MMAREAFIPKPGVRYGAFPEREHGQQVWRFFPAQVARSMLGQRGAPSRARQLRFLAAIHTRRQALQAGDIGTWSAAIRQLQPQLNARGLVPALLHDVFALLDACLFHHLGVRLHDAQFIAAWYLLERRLVEMQTGEGKTLAVSLAALTAALAGVPVHVVTANDYLVSRDAAALEALFAGLGLTVGAIRSDVPLIQRASIYRANIVYCTASELVFDYLRDHLALARDARQTQNQGSTPRCLRGLCLAIIDEADNILIDDARTPMILSQSDEQQGQAVMCRQMLFLASQLQAGQFQLDHQAHVARLNDDGRAAAEQLWQQMGGTPSGARVRREQLCSALAALHLFERDRHYLVADGKVAIIDPSTGRVASG
ncbi:MAG: DEAD/DEAH box helicase, partial [Janthinobacterium lividum]